MPNKTVLAASAIAALAIIVIVLLQKDEPSRQELQGMGTAPQQAAPVSPPPPPRRASTIFIAIDFSESSEQYRPQFLEAAGKVVSEASAKQLGVIGFGQKYYELYFGPMLTKRDYVAQARGWLSADSADSRGTDLSAPFLLIQKLLASQQNQSIAVYLFTDAGTELMTDERKEAFVRILKRLHQDYSLNEVFINGVRSGVDDNYRQQIRDLFAQTPVVASIR